MIKSRLEVSEGVDSVKELCRHCAADSLADAASFLGLEYAKREDFANNFVHEPCSLTLGGRLCKSFAAIRKVFWKNLQCAHFLAKPFSTFA